jgi:Tol biopolymer transport system component
MPALTAKRTAMLALAVMFLMLPLTASSQGSSSDSSLRIVFASDRGGPEEPIYTMNVDGTNIQQLLVDDGRTFAPACSPEGNYLAFYSESGLQVADANFTEVQTVVPWASALRRFSLSANASKVAFVLYDDETDNFDVYVSNRDGTGLARLTTHPAFDVSPALSPDGTKVVFASNRGEQHNNYELYVINADGSNLTQLTNTGGFNNDPHWSPDGTRIAFTSDRAGNGSQNVYVMNPDGSNSIPLTNNNAANYEPAWSPDGTQIAFVTDRDGNMEIYVMDADGTNVTRVTHDPYFDDQPCWLTVSPPDAGGTSIPAGDVSGLSGAIATPTPTPPPSSR